MHVLSSFLALCILSPLAFAAIAPRQSNAPCVYSCPTEDTQGFDLQDSSFTDGNARLRCEYTRPGSKYCSYNRTTGALIQDNNISRCPAQAPHTGNCVTKRAALPVRKIRENEQPARGKKVVMGRFNKRKN